MVFVRYDLANKPSVTPGDGGLRVSLFDPALGSRLNLSADRLVLSAGIEPHDNRELSKIFDVELNPDGFFQEANPKAAPLDSVDRGKFFCGLCHSPNPIEDVISQGNAAAARAGAILSKEAVEEKTHQAYVIKNSAAVAASALRHAPMMQGFSMKMRERQRSSDPLSGMWLLRHCLSEHGLPAAEF